MKILLETALAYVSTNMDDLVLVMLLFAQSRGLPVKIKIAAGKYLGTAILMAGSILGALGAGLLPDMAVRLLGLVPLGMGIYQWIRGAAQEEDEPPAMAGIWGATILTVVNGADNLGVYIPLFAGYGAGDFFITALVFAAMTALWCVLGNTLAGLPAVAGMIRRYRRILVPGVLVVLGVLVMMGL